MNRIDFFPINVMQFAFYAKNANKFGLTEPPHRQLDWNIIEESNLKSLKRREMADLFIGNNVWLLSLVLQRFEEKCNPPSDDKYNDFFCNY